jgi:hypothetical protein
MVVNLGFTQAKVRAGSLLSSVRSSFCIAANLIEFVRS